MSEEARIGMDISTPHVRTHDLELAAALLSCDFELSTTDRNKTGRLCFVFEQSSELTEHIYAYWADELEVKALTYSQNIKNLKNRIYAGE
jgi:hypothetical protein